MDLRLTDTGKLSLVLYGMWPEPRCLLWPREWSLECSRCEDCDSCTPVWSCVCVNSGPPAHFTHRQTSKAVCINPACRAALHAIRNFTSLLLRQHRTYMAIHIEMNRWSSAMQRITIIRREQIKLQKSRDTLRSVCRLCLAAGGVEVWAKCTCHVFLIKAGQLCFHCGPPAGVASLSPWLDAAEMMSRSHRCTHQSKRASPLLTRL